MKRCKTCKYFKRGVVPLPGARKECWYCDNRKSEFYLAQLGRNDPACEQHRKK